MNALWQNNILPISLKSSPARKNIIEILGSALIAVDPYQVMNQFIHRNGNKLIIGKQTYYIDQYSNIYLIAVGKASIPMTAAIISMLRDEIKNGIILTKEGHAFGNKLHTIQNKITLIEAGHPLPDERGVAGSKLIELILNATTHKDLVLCLLSGGGSALMTYPANGLTLSELVDLTDQLLQCGATINEINTLRKHVEKLKGGRLATLAAPATLVSLILSDVVGNPKDVIASGPSVPDPTTYEDALNILKHYNLLTKISPLILDHLNHGIAGIIPDTPKEGDSIFNQVQNIIIGSNQLACQAAQSTAQKLGYNSMVLTTFLEGEARQAGKFLASVGREIRSNNQPIKPPACVIASGETTVTIKGDGMGGRNLEVALGAVNDLAGLDNIILITLASDGGDGQTDAAGAVVTGSSYANAKKLKLDPNKFLAKNDSYHFFERLGDLILTGPTGTNVNDLNFLFVH